MTSNKTLPEMVKEFHAAMGLGEGTRSFDDIEALKKAADKLVLSEARELEKALADKDPVEVMDALLDIQYASASLLIGLGWDNQEGLNRIHAANMAKAGGPKCPDIGKQLKPEGWKPADLTDLVKQAA